MTSKKLLKNYAVLEYTVKGTYGESLQTACFSYPQTAYVEQGELREEINSWLEEEEDSNGLPVSFYSLTTVSESKAKEEFGHRINSI